MREIIFRGKRIDNGEWVKGFPISFHATLDIEGIETWDGDRIPINKETVGQFTGILDKNSKRIFEGDILKFGENKLMVWWNGEAFQWQAKSILGYETIPFELSADDWNNIELANIAAEPIITGKMTTEIIGNKWDNPELLEG